jgi:hypothetical protein
VARACMREAGCRMTLAPYEICKRAREPAGRMALHSVRVSCCLALYSLIWAISLLSFSFFPIHGCRCLVHIHGGLVHAIDARSRHGSRPTVSHQCWCHDRQIPRDAWICYLCVSERTWMLKGLSSLSWSKG